MPDGFEYFVSAAAPLSSMTARAVARQLHTRVLQGYGLTETTNFSTTMPVGLSEETAARLTHDTDIPSIGVALLGNEVAVLTPDGLPARPGEVGEICIRGHNVMTRYHDNPVATAEAFRGGWFHSQDLGSEIPHAESGQRFFVITGRTKNVAKVRGEAVSLEEMERMLCALPNVRDAACIAFPHRLLGEAIVAAVVFADGADETDPRDALRTMFAPSVLPQRIVRAEAIPRTPTGKILRPQLAQLLAPLA